MWGNGWHLYDAAFRQQISIERADFSKINQSLYSTTFLAYAGTTQIVCCQCYNYYVIIYTAHVMYPVCGILLISVYTCISLHGDRSYYHVNALT